VRRETEGLEIDINKERQLLGVQVWQEHALRSSEKRAKVLVVLDVK
jgi:uncharacterized protein YuzE